MKFIVVTLDDGRLRIVRIDTIEHVEEYDREKWFALRSDAEKGALDKVNSVIHCEKGPVLFCRENIYQVYSNIKEVQ